MNGSEPVLVLGYPSPLSELIANNILTAGHKVYLLVSEADLPRATPLKKQFGKQVQMLVGEGSHVDLGLGGKEYLAAAEQVAFVISAYPTIDGPQGADFGSLHARELIEFCQVATQLQNMVYLSDFSLTQGCDGVIAEHDKFTWNETAAQGCCGRVESVLQRFVDQFPITTIRVGTVVGVHESFIPISALALGFPELFLKSDVSLLLCDGPWLSQNLTDIALSPGRGHTFHLIQHTAEAQTLEREIRRLALDMVPRTYDIRAAARRWIRQNGWTLKKLPGVQNGAKVENTWTNRYFREHNFANWNVALEWQPLIENDVERLTGFR